MKRLLLIALAAGALTLTFAPRDAEACSCLPRTDAEHYCESDFAVRARVLWNWGIWEHLRYSLVRVQESFKGDMSGYQWVATGASSASCGVSLSQGTSYLMAGQLGDGGLAHVSLCGKVAQWSSLSRKQRAEWRNGYSCQAACPVGCNTWYDGCNTCQCEDGEITACTKRYCFQAEDPYCMDDEPAECLVTGCSGQVCADQEVFTTCEYRAEYACYDDAECARQDSGECGWTQTKALDRCLGQFE